MNLLELMLENKVVWPVGAGYAVQDYNGKIKFSDKQPVCNGKYYEWEECWVTHSVSTREQLNDWHKTIITREQYQAAGGWMGWEGGECPVPKETPILYSTKAITAEPARAGACSWEHIGNDSDILAYCVTAIIPERNPETVVRALERLYAKLGVTTLEGAFAKIDEGILASARHTIVHGPDTFKDCIILLRSRQTVVWTHNGKEYISPLTEVLIDPDKDELAAHLLSGLCKVQIAPIHIAEVRKQVGWVYPENN